MAKSEKSFESAEAASKPSVETVEDDAFDLGGIEMNPAKRVAKRESPSSEPGRFQRAEGGRVSSNDDASTRSAPVGITGVGEEGGKPSNLATVFVPEKGFYDHHCCGIIGSSKRDRFCLIDPRKCSIKSHDTKFEVEMGHAYVGIRDHPTKPVGFMTPCVDLAQVDPGIKAEVESWVDKFLHVDALILAMEERKSTVYKSVADEAAAVKWSSEVSPPKLKTVDEIIKSATDVSTPLKMDFKLRKEENKVKTASVKLDALFEQETKNELPSPDDIQNMVAVGDFAQLAHNLVKAIGSQQKQITSLGAALEESHARDLDHINILESLGSSIRLLSSKVGDRPLDEKRRKI
ncbi:unknown protein [Seminavis robusta]|uniref:Uncharacterized protein n=1 Tax=Seminavis robusta TaxID=568900 RepID=A0A9N8HQW2_9STRA|nr:unknown protein [Seminavis robusta]|eukprot:Sro1244_g255590.1 n/a (348) ;mRNA; r:19260-20303